MTIDLPNGVLVLLMMAAVYLLYRLGRSDPPGGDDDRVSRAWLEMFIRDRRER